MGASLVKEARAILREAQIAHYDQVERAIKALAGLARFSGGIKQENLFPKSNFKKPEFPRKKERAKLILEEIKSQEIKELVEYRSLEFLKAYGFKLPSYYLLENETQAKKVLQKLKGNLAFKIASDDLLHKSDFNAVLLNVPGSKAFQAYKKFRKEFRDKYPEFSLKGVLVMPMHKEPQLELMLGVVSDPGLGKGLLLGLGGIYAEALSDSAMISLPLNAKNLLRLFNSLKASKILAGARAKTPIDLRSLISLAYQIEALIQDFPEIKEIEFNPIFTYEKEIQILDARIILE